MIESVNGIKYWIYDNDHTPPHYHAIYGDERVSINIDTLQVMAGYMRPAKLREAKKWAKDKQAALRADFERKNS